MSPTRQRLIVVCAAVLGAAAAGLAARAAFQATATVPLAEAAGAWIAALDDAERARGVRPFADAGRTDWHFVPKPARKGVQLRDVTSSQQEAALGLMRALLSEAGYEKSLSIMRLEEILRRLEGTKAKNIRDPERYFFTVFGTPAETGTWSVSVEGHHLSLNFVIRDGAVVDSTPQFMGANPAEVKTTFAGLPEAGQRVLHAEEAPAFELVRSLDSAQRAAAVTADAPKEIRAAGEPEPPQEPATGIAWADLTADQQATLRRLVETYCAWMTDDVATERLRLIEEAGWEAIRFAWLGALEPGIGHAYRIAGPTFLVEFVNVQPDAEGNPANHIHCVWRDATGDFR
jgi:hypothetical protein